MRFVNTSYVRRFRFEGTAYPHQSHNHTTSAQDATDTRSETTKNVRVLRYSFTSRFADKRNGSALAIQCTLHLRDITSAESVANSVPRLVDLTNSIISNANTRTSVQVATYDSPANGLWLNQVPDNR